MTTDIQIEAYDIKTFCKAFSVSRTFVYEEMKAGRLQRRKVGRRTLIARDDALAWLHSRQPTVSSEDKD